MNKSSFERLLTQISLLLIFILLTRTPLDADQWWHLRAGEETVKQGHILLHDVFSYTRYGASWVNAFWLADVVLYLVFKIGGYFSLAAFVSLMGVATFSVTKKQMQGTAFFQALLLLLAALAAAPIWSPRPQLFSFLFLAVLDYWLFLFKKNPEKISRNSWLLLPFFTLWANLHGGYIWGVLLLIAFLSGETLGYFINKKNKTPAKPLKKLALFSFLSLFAVLINPNGLELWRLPFHTLDVSLSIQEWLSPDFHQISFHPVLWMLFLFILALGVSEKKLAYSELFKVLGFAYLTFISQRNVAPFAIILLPVLSRTLWDAWNATRAGMLARSARATAQPVAIPLKRARLINGFLLALISLAALGNLYLLTRPEAVDEHYPVAALAWIEENQPAGALFNSYNWGGYLIWNLRDYPVFIDGRADLYDDELLNQWKQVTVGGETAQQILDKWNVNLILLEPSWAVIGDLSQNGWELLYEDEASVIYGR
jgi:hypothetical protein